ncbi:hypothetical protein FHT87_006167 [Rhizobium sp. BK316]|uniref:hypothetical protein n=1 Tax=Rhizobium sp. BK316 TaxID=2587053 RepID=UPI0018191F7E|nr:hypothetical protein [Rhizobium sp. BK316]MBB3412197.1 hypothetical protein [Rhizobium sp. BK316]
MRAFPGQPSPSSARARVTEGSVRIWTRNLPSASGSSTPLLGATPLGHSLSETVRHLADWAAAHTENIRDNHLRYDTDHA